MISRHNFTFKFLFLFFQICQDHVGATEPEEADAHYRAVCRALVAEALELSSFLQKVSEGTNDLRQKTDTIASSEALDCLNFQDWVSVALNSQL